MTDEDLSDVPLVDLVGELVTREGVQVAHGRTYDVILIPRRFPCSS
jgi:hypothetical protein